MLYNPNPKGVTTHRSRIYLQSGSSHQITLEDKMIWPVKTLSANPDGLFDPRDKTGGRMTLFSSYCTHPKNVILKQGARLNTKKLSN